MIDGEAQTAPGPRFNFGRNWSQFLASLDEQRISEAAECVRKLLAVENLRNQSFLDVGSGSGLSSLVARRLGARVYSFDIDSECVACTQHLKELFFPDDPDWKIEQGSVLEKTYLQCLGEYDVVYSWGVLHHTGNLWRALGNLDPLVAPQGKLFIAIYNDQGTVSDFWRRIKRLYNQTPPRLRFVLMWPALIFLWGPRTIKDLLRGKPFSTWRSYAKSRGMSPWYDLVDWVGGYPFEAAKPEEIIDFYQSRGYALQKLNGVGQGLGCNEFVFTKL